ncbi:hypothetical protein HME9302_00119 [Alteripontixanthobacter maritimus]|uniref:Uncharacterized protein n=1 Tax=Alteripontixanthobacter maritimus TaxID=2161824 RepID=A0A369Q218_9SPHN|nr:tyrosine/phenylalanine carboxypeptidase domain-containing protein [Alteripontixanthobacter maritimus]RDC58943.1 hypothetical protein HME9302_00119 [Alteripontixanthobacter maritimus]
MSATQTGMASEPATTDYNFCENGALRQELDTGGWVHVDRPLPLLIINRYHPLSVDPDQAKRGLYKIDFKAIEHPVLETLFSEKRRELDHQLTMLDSRNPPRFRYAALMLYETVDSELKQAAEAILASPKRRAKGDRSKADCHEIADAARRMAGRYDKQDDSFDARGEIRDDLSSGMMVSKNHLYAGSSTRAPRNRIEPLLHHEVGGHLLTYVNGDNHDMEIFKNSSPDMKVSRKVRLCVPNGLSAV